MPLADREAEEHVLVRFLIISLFEEAVLRFDPEWIPAREARSRQLKTTGRDTKAPAHARVPEEKGRVPLASHRGRSSRVASAGWLTTGRNR